MDLIHLSIIIPTLKCPRTLIRAIESCLNIKNHNVEIIIVIDGPIRGASNFQKEIPQLPGNFSLVVSAIPRGGAAGARNYGIEKALGNWLFFLDDDDELCAENIDLALSYDLVGVDVARGNFLEVRLENDQLKEDGEESLTLGSSFEVKLTEPTELFHERGFWRYIYSRNFFHKCGITFFPERKILNSDYKHEEFFFLCLVLSSNPKTLVCNLNFYKYYIRQITESDKLAYLDQLLLDINVCKLFISSIRGRSQFLNKKFLAHVILDRLFFAVNYLFESDVEYSLRNLFSATIEVVTFCPQLMPIACKRLSKQLIKRVLAR